MLYQVKYDKLSNVLSHLPTSAYCIHFPFHNGSCTRNIATRTVQEICDLIVSYVNFVNTDLVGCFFDIFCYDNILNVSFTISFSFLDFVYMFEEDEADE